MREIARKAEPLWRRRLVTAAFDGACWTAALTAAGWLRYEFDVAQIDFVGLTRTIVIALAAVWLFGAGPHLYFDRHAKGRLDEALGLARVMALVGAVGVGFTLLGFAPSIRRSVPLIAALLALAMAVAGRLTRARHLQRDPGTVIFAGPGRILPRVPDERRVRHRRRRRNNFQHGSSSRTLAAALPSTTVTDRQPPEGCFCTVSAYSL